MKKLYIGNGYYYINSLHYFNINKKALERKKCLNKNEGIENRDKLIEMLKISLKHDLEINNIKCFWCVSHNPFIRVLEDIGYDVEWKTPLTCKAKIDNLFEYWESDECEKCAHNNSCHILKGELSKRHRKEYLLVFSKRKQSDKIST